MRLAWITALTLLAVLAASGLACAATSSTVVSATVVSATSLDSSACATGTSGVTLFGTVLPASLSTTSGDCSLAFGSSNDTAMLRASQTDGLGMAMYGTSHGAPDTAFNTTGWRSTATAPSTGADNSYAVGYEPDGKLVVAGSCAMGGATGVDFCVTRYATTGAPDPTFGSGGTVTTAIAPGSGADNATALVIQPDGKVVVAGNCSMSVTGIDFCLARYTTAGALDTTFHTTGTVTTPVGAAAASDFALAVALQADGSIVASGACFITGDGNDLCVARYTPSGTLDSTFGTGGIVTTAIAAGSGNDNGGAVVVDSSGRIVVGGYCYTGAATGYDFCVERYTAAGAPDLTFNGGHTVTAVGPGAGNDYGDALGIEPNGAIVEAGGCNMGSTGADFCLVRLTPAGVVDPSFGTGGIVTTPIAPTNGGDYAFAMAVQPDGMIVTGGQCSMGGSTGNDDCLARYTTSGALDSTFHGTGTFTAADAPGANDDAVRGMALGPDGTFATTGPCDMGGGTGIDFCTESWAAGGTASQYVPGVSDFTTSGTNAFAACLRTIGAGVTAQWTVNASCPASDGTFWSAIPTSPAKVAYTTVAGTVSTAALRFALRTTANQPAGSYVAPITFDVAAPNV